MSRSIYLIAYYSIKPKHKNTSQAGWMDNPDNVQWDEQIAVSNKLKPRDLQTAKVILDLSNRTVYRNSWNSERGFDDLFEHYYDGYKKYLDPVIQQLGYEMVEKDKVDDQAA